MNDELQMSNEGQREQQEHFYRLNRFMTDVLGSMLDDSIRLEGLEVDLDLRWELVTARATLGAASDDEIDAALAQDDTAKGRQLAETARAVRPDPVGKDIAWHRVATDTSLSNDLARAIAEGWRRTTQPELLAPTTTEYFAMLQRAWSSRSFTMASLTLPSHRSWPVRPRAPLREGASSLSRRRRRALARGPSSRSARSQCASSRE